jgi:hypothetical protein
VPDPHWEEGWTDEDCTPWLIEYVRVRLAEHDPELLEKLPSNALICIIPLTLNGLTRAPNKGNFMTMITFDEEDTDHDEPESEDAPR